MHLFERMKTGVPIHPDDSDYHLLEEAFVRAAKITAELNSGYHTQKETNAILSRLTCSAVDDSVHVALPFHTDFGQSIRFGKRVFVNTGCTFLDQGGITIGDDVLFGPNVTLITTNHPLDPDKRRTLISKTICIEDNAWIGANATVLPGLTIGKDSVVGASSVVTHDVPPGTVVVGNPARVIKEL